jgi:hypothetical protein
MTTLAANKAKFELANGRIDFASDAFEIILMDTGFVFDPDADHGYANVSADELANGNGYTTGGITLAGVTVTEDDTNNYTEVAWNNVTWTASGGSIGPTPGAIIYDNTAASPQADTVIGYIDFGQEFTQVDGGTLTVANPTVRLA